MNCADVFSETLRNGCEIRKEKKEFLLLWNEISRKCEEEQKIAARRPIGTIFFFLLLWQNTFHHVVALLIYICVCIPNIPTIYHHEIAQPLADSDTLQQLHRLHNSFVCLIRLKTAIISSTPSHTSFLAIIHTRQTNKINV